MILQPFERVLLRDFRRGSQFIKANIETKIEDDQASRSYYCRMASMNEITAFNCPSTSFLTNDKRSRLRFATAIAA